MTIANTTGLAAGPCVLAFDVGGTTIKSALIDEAGTLLDIRRTATPLGADSVAAVVDAIDRLAAEYAKDFPHHRPLARGALIPGIVDTERGVSILAGNLGWHDVPIRSILQASSPVPVTLEQDVAGASIAEKNLGAGIPYRDVVTVIIGTGIASTIFSDSHTLRAGGYAGELGHLVVDPAGPPCVCGNRGCLEAISSAGALVRRYEEGTGERLAGASAVIDRAMAGDAVAARLWDEALDGLALSLAHVCSLLAPEAIIIGGGLAEAGDTLFLPLADRLAARLTFQRRPALLPAKMGENAGLVGAALLARESLDS